MNQLNALSNRVQYYGTKQKYRSWQQQQLKQQLNG